MRRRKQPFQLETLALAAVGSYIKYVFHLCESQDRKYASKMLLNVSVTLFSSVPCYLSDKMAAVALKSINELLLNAKSDHANFDSGVFMHRVVLLSTLIATITTLHVKHINLVSWPKIMRYFLNVNLYRLEGLEQLDLGSGSGGWNTSEAEKNIVRGVSVMTHLKALYLSSDCTDHILRAVGDTCRSLQILDVTFSRSVTDRSISSLLCCSQLQKLNLFQTSITAVGFKSLLDGLPKLQDLGRFHEFDNVLELVSQEPNARFLDLRKVVCCDMTENNLHLLVKRFPLLSCVALLHEHRAPDIIILSALPNLTELILSKCDFFADRIDALLQICGPKLTLLYLNYVDQIDLNALVFISQHCPHLVTFSLKNCDLLDHAGPCNGRPNEPAFPCLERLKLYSTDCLQTHLTFLLSNSCNIRFVELSSLVDVTDVMMATVFNWNKMKQLQELHIPYSSNMSIKTVQLLMEHCDKLKLISDLRSWNGISFEELADLRKYIRENNLGLHL